MYKYSSTAAVKNLIFIFIKEIRAQMDKEKALKEIQSNIRGGNTPLASGQIMEMADCFSDDPFTLLTCASLLKVIDHDPDAEKVANKISGIVKDEDRLEAAKGLRRIGFPAEAKKILSAAAESDGVIREKMNVFFDLRMYPEASETYDRLSIPTLDDTATMIGAISAAGEHKRAVDLAEGLLAESPDTLNVQKCYCSVLFAAGKTKEAGKFVKDNLKKNKTSDAESLASYYLWIEGKTTSAGAYASKAIKSDQNNTLAMEILAYCLAEKGKISEARIVAGAINEKEPGNPAVVRILDMCKNTK